MMGPEPTAEHRWLQKLVGKWEVEMNCSMGPDQPPTVHKGQDTVRKLGDLWVIAEGHGEMPDGGIAYNVMTLGYDPRQKKFVGTFIASVMNYLWPYEGTLDESGKRLVLESRGPDMSGGVESATLVPYHDVIEWLSDDHRTLTSFTPGPDGQFVSFMKADYRRIG